MYTVEIFFTHFAIWVKNSPLGGGAHKISVQKQVRTAAQGVVLIFAKVNYCTSLGMGGIIGSINKNLTESMYGLL